MTLLSMMSPGLSHEDMHTKYIMSDINFQNLTVEDVFGFVKCNVLPPRNLDPPLLPVRCQGKLLFPLCYQCAEDCNQRLCTHTDAQRTLHGTWTTVELREAAKRGYRVSRTCGINAGCFANNKMKKISVKI